MTTQAAIPATYTTCPCCNPTVVHRTTNMTIARVGPVHAWVLAIDGLMLSGSAFTSRKALRSAEAHLNAHGVTLTIPPVGRRKW